LLNSARAWSKFKFIKFAGRRRARRLLEETEHGVDRIARSCGFGDEERERITFQRHLAISPRDYRRRFSTRLIAATASACQEV
jgi:AraC-like DNA-binding protein